MTPNEHLAKAEDLLESAEKWGRGSESAQRCALQATAHIQLAQAKVQRDTALGPSRDVWMGRD
jgi:hypothetical protein